MSLLTRPCIATPGSAASYLAVASALLFIFMLAPSYGKAQDAAKGKGPKAESFVTTKRLARAARAAWKAARKKAKSDFPKMPKAFNGPLVMDVESFEKEVKRFTGKSLDDVALVEGVRPMMRGHQVEPGKSYPKNGIRIALSGYDGIQETESGYKLRFDLFYSNTENWKYPGYVRYDRDIVWVSYEQQSNGKWRVVDTTVGTAVR